MECIKNVNIDTTKVRDTTNLTNVQESKKTKYKNITICAEDYLLVEILNVLITDFLLWRVLVPQLRIFVVVIFEIP